MFLNDDVKQQTHDEIAVFAAEMSGRVLVE